jgi:DNA-directed RNA polymerase specialized sigma24 family protein
MVANDETEASEWRDAGKGGIDCEAERMLRWLTAFEPLIRKLGRMYEGRGAEYEDVAQECRLYLIRKVLTRSDGELAKVLFDCLRGAARDAAGYMRRVTAWDRSSSIDCPDTDGEGNETELSIADLRAIAEFAWIDFDASMEASLSKEDYGFIKMMADGASRSEAAEKIGVTRQAVDYRIKRVRRALLKYGLM